MSNLHPACESVPRSTGRKADDSLAFSPQLTWPAEPEQVSGAIQLIFPVLLLVLLPFTAATQEAPLAGTAPLPIPGELSSKMVAGVDRFLMRELERSIE